MEKREAPYMAVALETLKEAKAELKELKAKMEKVEETIKHIDWWLSTQRKL